MANSSPDDEQLAKQQLKMKEMERKATFESTQNEIRRQKDSLQHLRRENKELRSALSQTAKGSTISSDQFEKKEMELLATKIHTQRRNLDNLKRGNDDKAEEVKTFNEKLDNLAREAQPVLSEASPLTMKIHTLENRLDKALIKHNEAMAIRRTYEQIVKRLRDERVGFDNQLAAIEKTLKAKEHDYAELSNMAHDAHHAKEIARAEVAQFKASYAEERRQKKKDLEDRKTFVTGRIEAANKQDEQNKKKKQQVEQQQHNKTEDEERRRRDMMHSTAELRTEEEHERLAQYAEAYRRIRDVTRANNVDDVIAKFIAQEDTHRTLVDMTRDVQARIDSLHTQRSELRRKLEENKYSGSGQLGSRRIVDEFQTHLDEARGSLDKASKSYERSSKQYTAVKAGVFHLAEKLSGYRPEMQAPTPGAEEQEGIPDVLKHCEQKLQMLVDEAQSGNEEGQATAEDQLARADMDLPPNNMRVKAKHDGSDDEGEAKGDGKDPDDAEEDPPHDRNDLKAMSANAVNRETKKARKRGRKKDEEA